MSWFCGLENNNFICEVERSFIEDSFNLYGIKMYFPTYYNQAIETILDKGICCQFRRCAVPHRCVVAENTNPTTDLSRIVAAVYGLIHQRYILTLGGLDVMVSAACAVPA